MYNTENIPKQNSSIPPFSEVPTYKSGPTIEMLRKRAIVIYLFMCIVGILPSILTKIGVADFSPAVQAAALGLWFPGAGLIAVGTIWCIVLGLVFYWIFIKFGATVWGLPGVVIVIVYLWVLSIVGGTFIAQKDTQWYALLIILIITVYTLISKSKFADMKYNTYLKKRKLHEEYIDGEAAKLEEQAVELQPREMRELDEDAIKAARYMFDMTLRQPGDFSGYESAEQLFTSALRYTLDYLGYSLAMMQCMYTPNFHGYLSKAQRFIIESFTRPEVCGYWKWEYLCNALRWNPDPIRNLNIMFSGWSGLVITLYGANTGDLRYEEPGALKFKPFANKNKTYDYSSKGIVEAIVRNWETYVTNLFPCEPHLTFPQCNVFAMDAVLTYDRQHKTDYLEKVFPALDKQFKENFILPSGELPFLHNTLLGFRSLDDNPAELDGANAFITSRILNAVNPGLAKRIYIFAVKDFLSYSDGEASFIIEKWDKMLDAGNFKKSPAYTIGLIAAVACEMGDRKTVRDMLEIADKYMEKLDDPSVLAYKKASVIGNTHIANARYAQKDDFYSMIHKGPGEGAFTGPLLTDCKYPNVLVARAMSDGDDLDLVLYNGTAPGTEALGIERLKPGKTYRIKDSKTEFTADKDGRTTLNVLLDGRTKVHIIPV